ncbi:putative non-ribosomal peptide synthase [Burkholderia pseudomallei MSHR543]|nr:putative non-ribosomal peptide synthase [Burkholderia pseudomallei MSHR543]
MAHGREPGISGAKRLPGEDTRFPDRVGRDRGAVGEGGGGARGGRACARLGSGHGSKRGPECKRDGELKRETPRRVLHGRRRCRGIESASRAALAELHGAVGVCAAGRVAADTERQAGPARIARAGGRRIRPRRIRSAAGRKRRSTGRDLAGAAACGARQPPRQLLRTRRPFAAGGATGITPAAGAVGGGGAGHGVRCAGAVGTGRAARSGEHGGLAADTAGVTRRKNRAVAGAATAMVPDATGRRQRGVPHERRGAA